MHVGGVLCHLAKAFNFVNHEIVLVNYISGAFTD